VEQLAGSSKRERESYIIHPTPHSISQSCVFLCRKVQQPEPAFRSHGRTSVSVFFPGLSLLPEEFLIPRSFAASFPSVLHMRRQATGGLLQKEKWSSELAHARPAIPSRWEPGRKNLRETARACGNVAP
jgi:hypothetical protein